MKKPFQPEFGFLGLKGPDLGALVKKAMAMGLVDKNYNILVKPKLDENYDLAEPLKFPASPQAQPSQ